MLQQIGAYRVLGTIGEGGMGVVLRARHKSPPKAQEQGGDVAIKVMNAELARDPDFRRRFEAEAEVGMTLQHPGIARTLDLVEDGGVLGLVMELVPGQPLHISVPHSKDQAVDRVDQLAEALGHAHARGVVHRDLKPENVMVRPDGRLVLLDFGIARRDEAAGRTLDHLGTVLYMAPEQAGRASTVTASADVYALALIAWELLAGHPPWPPSIPDQDILDQKREGRVPPITSARPDLRPEVDEVIRIATDPDPADRFGTAAAFARAFREALQVSRGGRPPLRTQEPVVAEVVKPEPARRTSAAAPLLLGALFIGVIAVGGAALLWMSGALGGHPDGDEVVSSVIFGPEPIGVRPLEQAPGRGHWVLTWKDGLVVQARQVHARGRKGATVTFTREDGVLRARWVDEHGVLIGETTWKDGNYSEVARSGVATVRGCAALGTTLDEQGRPTEERCLDPEGRVVIDENGCQVTRTSWSEAGDKLDSACFDAEGRPAVDAGGVHRTAFKVDPNGLEMERSWYGKDGARVLRAADGCAGWKTERDADGLAVGEFCVGVGGLAVTQRGADHAGWTNNYDANGCLSERLYVNESRLPTPNAEGVSREVILNDPSCFPLEQSWLDASGRLRRADGSSPAHLIQVPNAEGLLAELRCKDVGDVPMSCWFGWPARDGGSVQRTTYDGQGRPVEVSAFTADGRPTDLARTNYPHAQFTEYGADGRPSKKYWKDAQGRPATALGVWGFAYSYDALGAPVSDRFMDAQGRPTQSVIVCAELRTRYDEAHRLESKTCLDAAGTPIATTEGMSSGAVPWKGAASVKVVRDPSGAATQNVFSSAAGRPLRTVDCVAPATPCYR